MSDLNSNEVRLKRLSQDIANISGGEKIDASSLCKALMEKGWKVDSDPSPESEVQNPFGLTDQQITEYDEKIKAGSGYDLKLALKDISENYSEDITTSDYHPLIFPKKLNLYNESICFKPTGVRGIDEILFAVILSSNRFKDSSRWGFFHSYTDGFSYTDLIQHKAMEAARVQINQHG